MADAKKRIILYQEKTTVDNSDYVLTDSSANGTKKYQVTRILTEAEATAQAKVDAEAAAREAADNELKDDLEQQYTVITNPAWEFGFVNSTGEYVTTETKANITHLALIALSAGDTITLHNTLTNNLYFKIYQYSEYQEYIGVALTQLVETDKSYKFTVPSEGKYRIYIYKQYGVLSTDEELVEVGDNVIIKNLRIEHLTSSINNEIRNIQTEFNELINLEDITKNIPFYGKWLSSNNVWQDNPNRRATDYLTLKDFSTVTLTQESQYAYVVSTTLDKTAVTGLIGLTYNVPYTPTNDNQLYIIEIASTNSDALSIIKTNPISASAGTNGSVGKELSNAQHVRHLFNETVRDPLTLLHFSDLHADIIAMNRILDDGSKLDVINDAICTGDMVGNTAVRIADWWDESILTCIGNHDCASYDSSTGYNWTALSMADRDAYYIAPFESNWGIVHTSGTSYYYKDYASQKVRLIVMDAMLYTGTPGAEATAQTTWLSSILSDAITNDFHVLIAIHAPHGGATAVECSFSRFEQGAMPTLTDCNTPQEVIAAVATAISNGLKFVGYIVGHTHQDNIWKATSNGNQLMYCVTCAAVGQTTQWCDSDQHRSNTQDAFNLITIDTVHTLVKIVRGGGADIDDHMRTRKAICFDYSTGEKVGEVL